MARILFTSPVLEHPAAGGPQLRIENSIKALSRFSELHIVSRVAANRIGRPEDVAYLRTLGDTFCFTPSVSGLNASHSYAARAYRKFFPPSPEALFEKDASFFYNYVRKIDADIIWFGYGCISFPLIQRLRDILPDVKFVCDTDSVWSRFVLRELDVERDPARRRAIEERGRAKEIEEKENAALSDVTTAVSEVDAEYYREIAPQAERIHLFSNVIDLETYKKAPPSPQNFKTPALFLGGSYYSEFSPMVRSAKWVLAEVMPLVWSFFPRTHLYLVGQGSETHCSSLAGDRVSVTGKVSSVLPYLCNAACSLVPLAFESGTRFKILESGACAIPVVSTTLGAEGIPVTHGHDCLIADTPADFAQAILTLLQEPQLGARIGQNCRELVRKQYSIDSLVEEGKAIMSYLAVPAGRS